MSAESIEFHNIGGVFTSAFVPSVKVTEVNGGPKKFSALAYQCKLNVDWDGAPTAYGWDNPADAKEPGRVWDSKKQEFVPEKRIDHFQRNLKPLESGELVGGLRDATSPVRDKDKKPIGLFYDHNFRWVGVVSATKAEAKAHDVWIDDREVLRDRNDAYPVIQKDGPSKGYYVSQSGSAAISKATQTSTPDWKYLQSSYWDASAVPYCVWPSMLGHGVQLGDFGVAIVNQTGSCQPFFFADTGSTNILGECSGYLVQKLTGQPLNSDWYHVTNHMVSFLVFPKSGGGGAQKGQEARAQKVANDEIRKLSGVGNAEELCKFLALGADPDRYSPNTKLNGGKGLLPLPGSSEALYYNFIRALKSMGFQSARQPIRV